MKKIFIYLLSLLSSLFLGIISNDVVTFANSSDFTYEIVNGEAKITSYKGPGDIIIPDEFDGYLTTTIGYRAFLYNVLPKSVQLPNKLKSIENEAFIGIVGNGLADIQIPKSVTKIGDKAIGYSFWGPIGNYEYCKKLKNTIIRGYTGTVAESYANENGFKFIALDEEPEIPTTEPTEEPTEPIQPTETTETTVLETTTATETTLTEATEVTTETTLTETIAATETTDATSSFAASETTVPVTSTTVESVLETTDTVSTYITTETIVTTTTSTATLPETGYSKWYHDLIAAAVGMVGVGSAAIIKSGVSRKKKNNS